MNHQDAMTRDYAGTETDSGGGALEAEPVAGASSETEAPPPETGEEPPEDHRPPDNDGTDHPTLHIDGTGPHGMDNEGTAHDGAAGTPQAAVTVAPVSDEQAASGQPIGGEPQRSAQDQAGAGSETHAAPSGLDSGEARSGPEGGEARSGEGGEARSDEEGGEARSARLEREGEVAADFLEKLLDIADLDGDIDVDIEGDRAAVAIVDSDEGRVPRRLVGTDGKVLEALQELTRLAVQSATGERSRLMLDVAGHRASRRAELVRVAQAAITTVRAQGQRQALDPMTAFERKVVHDEVLSAGLVSESEGVEPQRYVVILPL